VLNLIDTPGHVDFTYEVSRSLEACEGAILLVDAAQGIEAQTLANCYLALENDLEIVPVLNKIDLPAADPEKYAEEIEHVSASRPDDVLRIISAKTGEGVPELLDAIVERSRAEGDPTRRCAGLIFDSYYDTYRGVVTYVRVIDGTLTTGERLGSCTGAVHEPLEVGVISPEPTPVASSAPARSATSSPASRTSARPGRRHRHLDAGRRRDRAARRLPRPQADGVLRALPDRRRRLPDLRDALEKLQLNDASLTYEPETSGALGFGFRCGFLGLLHMEIVRERLEREFDLDLIATAPNVESTASHRPTATVVEVDNPSEMPPPARSPIEEPSSSRSRSSPDRLHRHDHGAVPDRRGEMQKMEYLSPERVELIYTLPLAEIVFDFFDQLKSRTKGYASLDYEPAGYQAVRPREGRHPAQGRAGRRVQRDRAPDKAYDYGRDAEKLRS
jgi:GTP-binding protein LepA